MEETTTLQRFLEITKEMTMPQAVVLVSIVLGGFGLGAAFFWGAMTGGSKYIYLVRRHERPGKSFAESWAGAKAFFTRNKQIKLGPDQKESS